jgi:hypothetical protein
MPNSYVLLCLINSNSWQKNFQEQVTGRWLIRTESGGFQPPTETLQASELHAPSAPSTLDRRDII